MSVLALPELGIGAVERGRFCPRLDGFGAIGSAKTESADSDQEAA